MRFVVSFLLILATASAIVCPPEYCKTVNCEQLSEENCKGTIVPNSSFCGCCPTCMHFIDEGGKCNEFLSALMGVVINNRCKPGTLCINNTCVAY